MGGWLLLFALTALAAFAALGVVVRAAPEGRAERFVAWTAVFFAVIAAPVLALGYLGALRPGALAGLSIATSAAVFFGSAWGRDAREHAREIGRTAAALGRLPWDGLRLAVRARSFATLGVAGAAIAILWSVALTYMAPSENWDGFFYHEPMVGFALQNKGFGVVSLPPTLVVQQANGFPRLCESVAIWFCIFTDKSLIEIGNSLAAPGLVLATYALARARSRDAVACMGWGAAVLLMPAMYSQLRTSLIDVQVAFFLVAALHFATRPVVGRREAAFGTLCLVLLLGSKGTALVWAPPLALVMYARLLAQAEKGRRRAAIGVMIGGVVAMAGVVSLTLVRNYMAFRNPLWPVAYRIPALGVSWPGLITMETMGAVMPLRELLAIKYHVPIAGVGDIIARDYGYGVPWVVLPLAAASAVVIGARAARGRLRREPDRAAEGALSVAALGGLFLLLPPGPTVARYNVEIVAIAMAVIAAAAGSTTESAAAGSTTDGKDGGSRFHEGAVACTLILSLVPWVWTGFLGGLDMDAAGIARLFRAPAEARAAMNFASFQMPAETARRREQELGPGDLAIFTIEESFIGVLWNHRFDNRVEYAPFDTAPAFLASLDERCAKWALVGRTSAARTALASRPQDWEPVGGGVRQSGTVVYRRLSACHR